MGYTGFTMRYPINQLDMIVVGYPLFIAIFVEKGMTILWNWK